MGVWDFLVLVVLFLFLATGLYLLWLNFPTESTPFEEYVSNYSADLPLENGQFNPNMRYPDRSISYFISPNCSKKKSNDFLEAVDYLEQRTILDFYESERPEIVVSCSNIAPEPDEAGHFVAGEGGPSVIINATSYAVITLGKIALYNPESCDTPQVAVHELLHALGFEHNGNPDSILFEITNCDQQLDQYIVDEIRRLYSVPSAGDLVLERVEANKSGSYLSFNVVLSNYGLKDIVESNLILLSGSEVLKEFDTESVAVGSRKSLTITNFKISRKTQEISLLISTEEEEISKSNNKAVISLVQV